jgi:putative oxidoreductase
MNNATAVGVASVLGRVFIATIFLMSAIGNKIPQFNQVAGYMETKGVPFPQAALGAAIAFLLIGGVSLVIGWNARFGASLLLIFLILATYFFHDFWNASAAEKQGQMIHFMKNLALMGTMLFVIANGPGAWSVDNRK